MDALAQLALMTKAKLLFESSTSFLSFPALTPISYAADQMNFTNPSTAQQLENFADFSTWTNALPPGTIFQPSLDTMLWDVYQGILDNAELATGTLTPEQSAALAAAQGYLTTTGSDGLNVDTPAMVAYRQYRQAWFNASQSYNNQKITALTSSDANVVTAWKNGGDAAAQSLVTAALSDWQNLGYKAQVEAAQLTEQTLGALSPQTRWKSWRDQCNPALDFPTNPGSNSTFGATLFEPYDVVASGSWSSFTINGPDIPNLVAQAPPELKAVFTSTAGTSTIKTMSFEYCSVAVERPWFDSALLSARFWKLPDSSVALSNGGDPPVGAWPSYVNAVVFARNICITTQGSTTTATPQPLPPVPVTVLKPVTPPHPITPIIFHPHPVTVGGGGGGYAPITHGGPPHMLPMMAEFHATSFAASSPLIHAANEPVAHPMAPVAAATLHQPTATLMINPVLRERLLNSSFAGVASANTQPGSQSTTSPVNTSTDSRISVLAFVCKRLPRCPNPDPSLHWS